MNLDKLFSKMHNYDQVIDFLAANTVDDINCEFCIYCGCINDKGRERCFHCWEEMVRF